MAESDLQTFTSIMDALVRVGVSMMTLFLFYFIYLFCHLAEICSSVMFYLYKVFYEGMWGILLKCSDKKKWLF